jgi:hypothetical protein
MNNEKLKMKNLLTILILTTFFSCSENLEKAIEEESKEDVLNVNDSSKKVVTDYIYESDLVKIIGDTTIDKSKIYYPEIKFQPYVKFNDYPSTKIYSDKRRAIDYNSDKIAKRFKTVITDGYNASEINFAGFYSLIWWGCGTSCQQSAIVDWRDGKVYKGVTASLGYSFVKESRMIITNPPDSLGFYPDCGYCIPEIWIWNEDKKEFYQISPE